jgi:molybdenum cofactor cytidylyltransferase
VRPGDAALRRAFAAARVPLVECARADEGMGASLAAGVDAADDAQGWVIALADMPWIAPSTIAQVVAALQAGASIAAPRQGGRRGHPVAFAKVHGTALRALHGDEGARALLAVHAAAVREIDVDDPGVLRDVDVPADLVLPPP